MHRTSTSTKWAGLGIALALAGLAVGLVNRLVLTESPRLLVDEAGLLSPDEARHLSRYHDLLLKDHDIDYRVLTTRDAGDLNRFSVRKFSELKVGDRSRTGRGFLLTIDAAQNLVRLEVSRALEGVFTDAFTTYVQHRQMVPFFRSNRVADGILATTELIVSEAQAAVAGQAFDPRPQEAGSSGGGAITSARLGQEQEAAGFERGDQVEAGTDPAATVRTYLRAMKSRNARRDLDLYTSATRQMLSGWTMTPAQMDMTVRTYARCTPEPARVNAQGSLAVVRYPPAQRQCAPWFLEKQKGRWRLDLTMMQEAIRFGRSNAWRFEPGVEHPYEFAFSDWAFDRLGFPRD